MNLITLRKTSKYWTLLNDLSRDNKTTSPDIANITWFNYFQELNDNKLNAPNSDIEKDLRERPFNLKGGLWSFF